MGTTLSRELGLRDCFTFLGKKTLSVLKSFFFLIRSIPVNLSCMHMVSWCLAVTKFTECTVENLYGCTCTQYNPSKRSGTRNMVYSNNDSLNTSEM